MAGIGSKKKPGMNPTGPGTGGMTGENPGKKQMNPGDAGVARGMPNPGLFVRKELNEEIRAKLEAGVASRIAELTGKKPVAKRQKPTGYVKYRTEFEEGDKIRFLMAREVPNILTGQRGLVVALFTGSYDYRLITPSGRPIPVAGERVEEVMVDAGAL